MARARNIKPSFFANDELAEIEPMGRLLFIGLWTLADYKGELEWRPKKIKAQLFPYDDCDIEKLAINLEQYRFIRFYSASGSTYINIGNFLTHQNPHKNEREKGSKIPSIEKEGSQVIDFKGLAINRDKSRAKREYSASDRADSLFLIPDSLFLIPKKTNTSSSQIERSEVDQGLASARDSKIYIQEIFDYWVSVMNKSSAAKLTPKRKTKIRDRLRDGYTVDQIKNAIDNCAASEFHMGGNDNGTVYDDIELICRSGEKLEQFLATINKNQGQYIGKNKTAQRALQGEVHGGQKTTQRTLIQDLTDTDWAK